MASSNDPITLDGPPAVDSFLFKSMELTESLGQPFRYELQLLSDDPDLEAKDVLGEAMSVHLQLDNQEKRHFNGLVSQFSLVGAQERHFTYRVVLRPWLWFLGRVTNCRIFQHLSVPDIIKQVFREHGFSDFEELLSGDYPVREYVVQYRESDLNFVSRLMEEAGIYYFFKHEESLHLLLLADDYGSHDPVAGYETVKYFPPDRHLDRVVDHVDRWEVLHRVHSGASAVTDFDFERPKANLLAAVVDPAEHALAEFEGFDYPGGYVDEGEGKAIAKRWMERMRANRERVRGQGNARGLSVGSLMTLEQHPAKAQNREYLLLSMSARLALHDPHSGLSGDDHQTFSCRFEAMDSGVPFRPTRRTPKPVVQGAQTATVVGKDGEEIWTDEYGRVKLQFHWDRYSPANEESSRWVRVSQAWAGSGFGAIHVPRMGQEVLVDFLEGDPDQPIVTGRVYNFDNKPPYELPKNQTQSGIKSRSTKQGNPDNFNEIRFEDKKGQEQLFLQAEKDHVTNVKNDQTTTVKMNRSASVGAGDSVTVGGDRSLSVSNNMSVSVGTGGAAKSTLNVTGTHAVDATDTIEVQAPTHIKLTCGGSSITIEPGKITLSAGGGSSLVLDQNGFMESSGGSSVLLDANACAQASGGAKLLLDGNVLAESSAMTKMVLDGNAAVESLGDIILQAMNISGTGMMQVALESAASSYKLSPAGCEVTGPTVNVNGTATVGVMAPIISVG